MFPVIHTIDDVLPHIHGNDNFSVNRKEDYIVIDYILNTPETFHNAVERECRGIIFHADGRIMSRRLHKFFNVNERPETMIENIDLGKPHRILEKLDGSMITPIFVNGRQTWGSKAGETFLTPQIEEFVKDKPNYVNFAQTFMANGLTPIFEWMSRKNRIVIDHPIDRLALIAIRSNKTGEYCQYNVLVEAAKAFDIDYVQELPGTVASMEALIAHVKDLKGIEGYVIRFDDGFMVKMKADEYIRFHRAKDDINLEKNVIAIMVNGQADDFRTLLMDTDRARFEKFEKDFWYVLQENAKFLHRQVSNHFYSQTTKKNFALKYQKDIHPLFRFIFFKNLGQIGLPPSKIEIMSDLLDLIKKNCSSQSHIDKVRPIWNNKSWYDYI